VTCAIPMGVQGGGFEGWGSRIGRDHDRGSSSRPVFAARVGLELGEQGGGLRFLDRGHEAGRGGIAPVFNGTRSS
jgi:hypothetical protein